MNFKNTHQQVVCMLSMLLFINSIEFIVSSRTNSTIFSNKSRFQRIYSRQKRYVVFPPGSAVVAAASLLKSLQPIRPSGINQLFEVEFYYPLQTSIAEWYPKEPKKPKPPEPTEPPKPMLEFYDPQQSPQHRRNYNIDERKYWQQYAVHRNRRDIVQQIERVASKNGFEIRSCLLRIICEANHYLLPPGQSFFQDVLRILFTTTHKDGVPDEYSHTMQVSEDECVNEYGSRCQYSILGFLLQNAK